MLYLYSTVCNSSPIFLLNTLQLGFCPHSPCQHSALSPQPLLTWWTCSRGIWSCSHDSSGPNAPQVFAGMPSSHSGLLSSSTYNFNSPPPPAIPIVLHAYLPYLTKIYFVLCIFPQWIWSPMRAGTLANVFTATLPAPAHHRVCYRHSIPIGWISFTEFENLKWFKMYQEIKHNLKAVVSIWVVKPLLSFSLRKEIKFFWQKRKLLQYIPCLIFSRKKRRKPSLIKESFSNVLFS